MSRIFIGRIASRTKQEDIEDLFKRFGEIKRFDFKLGFAFIEYADKRDAEDAIRDMNGQVVDEAAIVVETAKGPRENAPTRTGGAPLKTGLRIRVEGLSSDTSWQDLKDFARTVGRPLYTDVFADGYEKVGVVEFETEQCLEAALSKLHGQSLKGKVVSVTEEKTVEAVVVAVIAMAPMETAFVAEAVEAMTIVAVGTEDGTMTGNTVVIPAEIMLDVVITEEKKEEEGEDGIMIGIVLGTAGTMTMVAVMSLLCVVSGQMMISNNVLSWKGSRSGLGLLASRIFVVDLCTRSWKYSPLTTGADGTTTGEVEPLWTEEDMDNLGRKYYLRDIRSEGRPLVLAAGPGLGTGAMSAVGIRATTTDEDKS
eukprot:gene3635-7250_t